MRRKKARATAAVGRLRRWAERYYGSGEEPDACALERSAVSALEIFKRKEYSPALADALYCLASIYYRGQEYGWAQRLQRAALQIRRKIPPPVAADLLHDYELLVHSYCQGSRFAQARSVSGRWLKLAEAELGPDDPYTSDIRRLRAQIDAAKRTK